MVKIVFRVDGMKGETIVIAEDADAADGIRAAIEAQGYRVLSVTCEPYEKRGLFHRK